LHEEQLNLLCEATLLVSIFILAVVELAALSGNFFVEAVCPRSIASVLKHQLPKCVRSCLWRYQIHSVHFFMHPDLPALQQNLSPIDSLQCINAV